MPPTNEIPPAAGGPGPVDDAIAAVKAELGQADAAPPAAVEEKPPAESKPPAPPPAPPAQSDQDFVVQKIQGYKDMIGFGLAMRYRLEIDDEVDRFLKLRPNTERLLRANAAWLAEKLRGSVGDGKAEVVIALMSEGWYTVKGMKAIAAKRNPVPAAPAAEEEEGDPDAGE